MRFGPIKLERIATFDLLRGFFLVVIILNHLYYYPSGLDWLTGRGNLYVSSAEGFFLISGIMLGLVRGRKLIAQPLAAASKLIALRAFQLYLALLVLTIGFTLIAWLLVDNPGLKSGYAPANTPLLELIWNTLTMQYTYGWVDFLRLYVIFMLATPLALWLLRRGWWYVVLIASGLVWSLFPDLNTFNHEFLYMPVSWQLVFFCGVVIGFHWPEITQIWQRITPRVRAGIGPLLLVTMIVTAAWSAVLVFGSQEDIPQADQLAAIHREIEEPNFDKNRLPPGRLILGAIWFWALFWLVRRFEPWFVRRLGWLLTLLGQASLYVYIVHSFFVFGMHFLWEAQVGDTRSLSKLPINLALSLAVVAAIWYMTRQRWLFRIIPR